MYPVQQTQISHLGPRDVRPFSFDAADTREVYAALEQFGIGIDARDLQGMIAAARNGMPMLNSAAGMDALLNTLTTPSLATPVQFLQEWLPGFVFVITQARKIDELAGITTQGRWEDDEIVQGLMEHIGTPLVYGDHTNIPLSSWNVNFETRTIVRFEEGMSVGRLEEARAASMRVSSAESKRIAAAQALEIVRNDVGFNGYNGGANRTYGLLNDPSLIGYVTAPTGDWGNVTTTFLLITGDLRAAIQTLRTQSGDRIDPASEALTLAVAMSSYDYLSKVSDYGNSVLQWLREAYPQVRTISVPQFDAANGGQNVFYLYAEGVSDDSTDDRRTLIQVVPAKFQTLGVEQKAKRYVEDYTNATAGILVKRPFAIVRFTNI